MEKAVEKVKNENIGERNICLLFVGEDQHSTYIHTYIHTYMRVHSGVPVFFPNFYGRLETNIVSV